MNDISLKINKIAEEYFSDNNSRFAKAMNTSEANIRNYRNGTVPKIDFIIKLAEKLEINFEWILLSKGKKNRLNNKHGSKYQTVEELNQNPLQIYTQELSNNITFVPIRLSSDYLIKHKDIFFLKSLPSYRLPQLNDDNYRMFQLNNHSMYPTLHYKTYVIGKWVENWITDIKDDQVYIIVSHINGIVIRRILNRIEEYGNLYCKSDNRSEYPNIEINKEDIIEVWEYKMHISSELLNPIDLYNRVNDLEVKIMLLEKKR